MQTLFLNFNSSSSKFSEEEIPILHDACLKFFADFFPDANLFQNLVAEAGGDLDFLFNYHDGCFLVDEDTGEILQEFPTFAEIFELYA